MINPRLLFFIGAAAIIYFGFMYSGNIIDDARSCAYTLNVESYDSQTNTLTLSASASGIKNSGDCAGFKSIEMPIGNQKDCEAIGFIWQRFSGADHCLLHSEWFGNSRPEIFHGQKVYTSEATSTERCINANGCGGQSLVFNEQRTDAYIPSFDGFRVSVPSGNSDVVASCTIKIKVTTKQNEKVITGQPVTETTTETTTTTPATTETTAITPVTSSPDLTIYKCRANMDCVSTCGSATPTCKVDTALAGTVYNCFCDNLRTTEDLPQIKVTESWSDKINNFIQSIIDWVTGIFK